MLMLKKERKNTRTKQRVVRENRDRQIDEQNLLTPMLKKEKKRWKKEGKRERKTNMRKDN